MTGWTRPEVLWGIALSTNHMEQIADAAGAGFQVYNKPPTALPQSNGSGEPLAVFVSEATWRTMPEELRKAYRDWEGPQRVLVLEPETEIDFEAVVGQGFLTAVRAPLGPGKIQEIIFRALEVKSLYSDILRMAREICLERELLTRKTDQLMFLNRVLSRATQSLDPAVILARSAEDFNLLFPLQALQAVFFETGEDDELLAQLFLAPSAPGPARSAWVEKLLEAVAEQTGRPVDAYTIEYLDASRAEAEEGSSDAAAQAHLACDLPAPALPDPGEARLLPLFAGECFGLLALSPGSGVSLAKDQVQSVRAAVNHLALAFKNALAYRRMQYRADFDGLTRIHNRRSFEDRLVEELSRHTRHREPLSLLLLDLDHFKVINDTYGHLTGDAVLAQVGRLLADSLRISDIPARFGGEEFVVLLPHTSGDQARMLAERLRQAVESTSFCHEELSLKLTASIGVAAVEAGPLEDSCDLLRRADQALYVAKAAGRNAVRTAEAPLRYAG